MGVATKGLKERAQARPLSAPGAGQRLRIEGRQTHCVHFRPQRGWHSHGMNQLTAGIKTPNQIEGHLHAGV